MRLLFFGVVLFLFYLIFFKLRSRLGNWLAAGIFVVIIGALVTLLENKFDADSTPFWGGLLRELRFDGFRIYFYDLKTALLIEIICFYVALHIKMQSEQTAKIATENLALQLESERDTLLQELTAHTQKAENVAKSLENPFILRGLKIIEAHFRNADFSVKTFAQLMFMSRTAFSTKWKHETDETPSETISRVRLTYARNLLQTTTDPISDIAYQAGFNDPAHFSRAFTDYFGQSPSKYRNSK